mgnify:CR=1 FL=1
MKKLFSRLSSFITIAFAGIHFWSNKPLQFKLQLNNVKKSLDGKLTFINLTSLDGYYKNWNYCTIAINNEKQKIDCDCTTPWLFDKQYKGSGYLGIIIFSLPIVILCSPYIAATILYYKILEKICGFSRHSRVILKTLKGQLNPETEKLLIMAMKNSWQLEQYLNQKLTFKEAQIFLREQRLVKQIYLISENETYTEFYWFDDKDNLVAQVLPDYDFFSILVLDSFFTKKKAKTLFACYKTMEIKEIK